MTAADKLLFVAALSLVEDPSACPIWLEGALDGDESAYGAVIYPKAEQVFCGDSHFVLSQRAYDWAASPSGLRDLRDGGCYVALRKDDRVTLYLVANYREGRLTRLDNPYAKPVLSRHLTEIGLEGAPCRPQVRSRLSALAERLAFAAFAG